MENKWMAKLNWLMLFLTALIMTFVLLAQGGFLPFNETISRVLVGYFHGLFSYALITFIPFFVGMFMAIWNKNFNHLLLSLPYTAVWTFAYLYLTL